MKSFDKLVKEWQTENRNERLGQYFCNRYIKKPYPELYYEADYFTTAWLIAQWLVDHNYQEELPQKVFELPSLEK